MWSKWRWDVRIVDVGGDAAYLNQFNIERRNVANYGGRVVAGYKLCENSISRRLVSEVSTFV